MNPHALYASRCIGTGHYLPERVVSNEELSQTLDTSDEWVFRRTGIRQRHLASADQRVSDLAAIAANQALDMAGRQASEVDLLVLASTTPDHTFPATATRIAHRIGARCPAFDIQAVCAGFIFGLTQADMAIRLGTARTALVIGAEVYSRILDWTDRGTCVLFGDGAGAVVLEQTPRDTPRRLLDTTIASDGAYYDDLYVNGGVFDSTSGCVTMDGREVYRHAILKMTEAVELLVERQGLTKDEIDWLIPHQANIRIMEQVGERLDLPGSKLIATVEQHANISAATIPTALDISVRQGRIQAGHLLALTALGGGFSWGGALLRF